MKRSEAIKKIYDFLITYEDCQITEDTAGDVLTLVERFGMLPPEYNLNEGSGKYNIPGYYENEWEPEND